MLEHILSAIVVLHSQCQDYLRECSQRGRTARAAEDGKCTKVSTLAEGTAPASTLRGDLNVFPTSDGFTRVRNVFPVPKREACAVHNASAEHSHK